jgi:hypothetical protein
MPEGCEILDPNLSLTLLDWDRSVQTKLWEQSERRKVQLMLG